jgi:hypothetical protein
MNEIIKKSSNRAQLLCFQIAIVFLQNSVFSLPKRHHLAELIRVHPTQTASHFEPSCNAQHILTLLYTSVSGHFVTKDIYLEPKYA